MIALEHLRDYLIAEGLVRRPDVAGALPPVWKHPDGGAMGPGDARDQGRPAVTFDTGLVVSLMHAPGLVPEIGAEERRMDGVDVVFRGDSVPEIRVLEAAIALRLLGDPAGIVAPRPDPGGRTDWVMAGLYIIQARQWSPMQPVAAVAGVFTFRVSYIFEYRVG